MRVDWCVSSWFRIKNTHSLTHLSLKSLCGGGVPSSHPSLGLSVFFLSFRRRHEGPGLASLNSSSRSQACVLLAWADLMPG